MEHAKRGKHMPIRVSLLKALATTKNSLCSVSHQ